MRALHRKSTAHEQQVLRILKSTTCSSECNFMWIPRSAYCARMYSEADLSQSQVMGTLGTSLRRMGTYDVRKCLNYNTFKKKQVLFNNPDACNAVLRVEDKLSDRRNTLTDD